jgi:hypothetical protein
MRRKLVLFLGLCALTVSAVAGCDGDDDGDENATPSARATANRTSQGTTPSAGGPTRSPDEATSVAERENELGGAVAVLTAAAGGQSVPEATLQAAQTIIAAATQTPIPTAISTAEAVSTRERPPAPVVSIDADPDNGSGPCDIVDNTVSVSAGQQFEVAFCLESGERAPINAALNTLELRAAYTNQIGGVAGSGNGTTDLDSNPDFNQAAMGDDWDCNVADDPRSAPQAQPEILIACTTNDFQDNAVPGSSVMIALVRLNAVSAGQASITFTDRVSLLSGNQEALCVENQIQCNDASVNIN